MGGMNKFLGAKLPGKTKPVVYQKTISSEERILTRWNTFPQVPQHKKKITKVYKSSIVQIRKLLRGNFGEGKEFSPSQLEKFPNMEQESMEKWTPTEIMTTLINLSSLYREGFWPQDKSRLPKCLPILFFNPKSGYSFFFQTYFNPPRTLREETEEASKLEKIFDIKIIRALLSLGIDTNNLSKKERKVLEEGLHSIVEFHKNLKRDPHGKIKYKFPSPYSLFMEYISLISLTLNWKTYPVSLFSINSRFWATFIGYVKTTLGLELKTTSPDKYR